jgi:FKBP-type peptidyl-prolyl cis-trans isomerase SlyD
MEEKVSDTISEGKVVGIHYTLKDTEGNVLDSSVGQDPLVYLHGGQNIVVGLEKGLEGKAVGWTGDVEVVPAEGYGEVSGNPPQPVPRETFPEDMELAPGMQFLVQAPDGNMMPIWINEVTDDLVHIDLDHPLAGATLFFTGVEVVLVREPTAAEVEHGHPHGLDGQASH